MCGGEESCLNRAAAGDRDDSLLVCNAGSVESDATGTEEKSDEKAFSSSLFAPSALVEIQTFAVSSSHSFSL